MESKNNQKKKESTVSNPQLPIDFDACGKINDNKVSSGKVLSIKAITERQRMSLIKDIVNKTKSF